MTNRKITITINHNNEVKIQDSQSEVRDMDAAVVQKHGHMAGIIKWRAIVKDSEDHNGTVSKLPETNAVTIEGPTGHDIVRFIFYDKEILVDAFDGQQSLIKEDLKQLRMKLKKLEDKMK